MPSRPFTTAETILMTLSAVLAVALLAPRTAFFVLVAAIAVTGWIAIRDICRRLAEG